MPVLDQVQDDGSGIQLLDSMKRHWIPGQARNDKMTINVILLIMTQPLKGEGTVIRIQCPSNLEIEGQMNLLPDIVNAAIPEFLNP